MSEQSETPRMIKEFSQMVREPRMNWEMIAFAMKDKAVELDELLKSAVNETWKVGTHNEELQAELTAARAEVERLTKWTTTNGVQDLADQLKEARAEIERLDTASIHSCSDTCQRPNCVLRRELRSVTEQRDRLAEALKQCRDDSVELLGERDWWQHEPRCDYLKRYQETRDNLTRADEALQSLTTNKEDQERKSPASDGSEI